MIIARSSQLNRRIRWLTGCVLAFLVLASFSVTGARPSQGDLQSVQPAPAGQTGLSVKGRLVPRQYVDLSLPAGGRAAEVYFKEGERVQAGAVVVELDSYQQRAADVAAAVLEEVLAQQALDDLYRNADVALAQAGVTLAQARKDQAYAQDRVDSLGRSKPQLHIDQAYANMLLAQKRLAKAQDDLEKAEKKYANRGNIIWMFVSRNEFKLRLTLMRRDVAYYERRYQDAKDKYEDLLAPVDEIDLAVAEGNLAAANAGLRQAERQRAKLQHGPDLDAVEAGQARLRAAQAQLEAARTALQSAQIIAPISGALVTLNVKPGEWMPPGKPVARIAVLTGWTVETKEVKETSIPQVQVGQKALLIPAAYPQTVLNGTVESTGLLYREDDGDIFYTVKIDVQDPDPRLRWGMSVRIDFIPPKLAP